MTDPLIPPLAARLQAGEATPELRTEIQNAVLARRAQTGGHRDWALLCEQAGLLSLAFSEFQLALRDDAHDEVAAFHLAQYYRERGDVRRAVALLERLLARDPARRPWLDAFVEILVEDGAEPRAEQAIALLLRCGIDCVFLTSRGAFRGRLVGRTSKNVALRLAQLHRAADPAFCLRAAKNVVAAKIKHQRDVLLRAQRRLHDESLAVALGQLRLVGQRAETATNLDVLRGLEGQAAATYFAHFGKLLRNDKFRFEHRSRRPPRDPVNACLSFGYAVLGATIETEILRCGLDPYLGFFHQPAYGRPSLMLDLLEEFRPLIDQLVLRLFNRRQLGPEDFERRTGQSLAELLAQEPPCGEPSEPIDSPPSPIPLLPANTLSGHPLPPLDLETDLQNTPPPTVAGETPPDPSATPPPTASTTVVGVYLNDTGRKVFLAEFFRRLREQLLYPPRAASLELRDILREQVYHLGRVIEGKQPDYLPFVPD